MENIPNWMICLSLKVNKLTGGKEGYSLCARFYEGRLEGKIFHTIMVKVSDSIFFFDPDHCRKSYLLRTRNLNVIYINNIYII